jgi:SAM-dependent methyltransferase
VAPRTAARYDTIGVGYAAHRRADPRIAAEIMAALGDARTVVNVGAGTGNYEPADRPVVAIEPSAVMAAQRPSSLTPAILASAERLPLVDDAADAVMAVLTIHHWSDARRGIAEALRVARRRVVLLTIDPLVQARMWLFADYLPDVAARDAVEFPAIDDLLDWLGPNASSRVVPIPRDCSDRFMLTFWGTPESLLDAGTREASSGFARMDDEAKATVVARLRDDLSSGAWDAKHGALRALDAYDAGLRLVVADL